jgi:hypothetical protein
MTEPTICTTLSVASDNPIQVANAFREFAGRIERGEVSPGQEGTLTESCIECGDTVVSSWECSADEDDEGVGGIEDQILKAIFGDNVPAGARLTPIG